MASAALVGALRSRGDALSPGLPQACLHPGQLPGPLLSGRDRVLRAPGHPDRSAQRRAAALPPLSSARRAAGVDALDGHQLLRAAAHRSDLPVLVHLHPRHDRRRAGLLRLGALRALAAPHRALQRAIETAALLLPGALQASRGDGPLQAAAPRPLSPPRARPFDRAWTSAGSVPVTAAPRGRPGRSTWPARSSTQTHAATSPPR